MCTCMNPEIMCRREGALHRLCKLSQLFYAPVSACRIGCLREKERVCVYAGVYILYELHSTSTAHHSPVYNIEHLYRVYVQDGVCIARESMQALRAAKRDLLRPVHILVKWHY